MKYAIFLGTLSAGMLFFTGCGDNTDADKVLEKESVTLTDLANNVVTFNDGISAYSYKFCDKDQLVFLDINGTWDVNGNDLGTDVNSTQKNFATANGKLEKGKQYTVNGDHNETVEKIEDTVCGF